MQEIVNKQVSKDFLSYQLDRFNRDVTKKPTEFNTAYIIFQLNRLNN